MSSAHADTASCRRLLRQGSRSFWTASLLLPAALRNDLSAVYAFCRVADDAVDAPNGNAATVPDLRARLDRVYRQTPDDHPVDRAFARVVQRHRLPLAVPNALLEGFTWDFDGRAYETIEDLYAYAVRVAGSVGVLVSLVAGRRDAETLARACDLGVAMQLTNIARDVGEDARRGRLYLPRTWMHDAGIDPDGWLANPTSSPALRAMVGRVLDHAATLYNRSETGISRLPERVRFGIWAARFIYADIGSVITSPGFDVVRQRAVTSPVRKAQSIARAAAAALYTPPARGQAVPPLAAAGFLVAQAQTV